MMETKKRMEIDRKAAESGQHIMRILTHWTEGTEIPRMGVLCIGANSADDLLRKPEHEGVSDLVHASMTLLGSTFLSAWAISKPRAETMNADFRRRRKIGMEFSGSLFDSSGRSVLSQLDYLPSIVIFLPHGSQGPSPYLEDDVGGGWITARDAASELASLPGSNLLVVLPCCYASTVSKPFVENDRIGSVYAPLDEEIGDREFASMLRSLGDEIRKLDIFTISKEARNAEA